MLAVDYLLAPMEIDGSTRERDVTKITDRNHTVAVIQYLTRPPYKPLYIQNVIPRVYKDTNPSSFILFYHVPTAMAKYELQMQFWS
jgi:hypothetical protein